MSMDDTEQQWDNSSPSRDVGGDLAEPPDQAWMCMTILPAQFYRPVASPAHGRPEAALMRAVLEDAVQCVCEGWHTADRSKQRLAREALGWPQGRGRFCPAVHGQDLWVRTA